MLAERLSAADTRRPVFLSPPPRHNPRIKGGTLNKDPYISNLNVAIIYPLYVPL